MFNLFTPNNSCNNNTSHTFLCDINDEECCLCTLTKNDGYVFMNVCTKCNFRTHIECLNKLYIGTTSSSHQAYCPLCRQKILNPLDDLFEIKTFIFSLLNKQKNDDIHDKINDKINDDIYIKINTSHSTYLKSVINELKNVNSTFIYKKRIDIAVLSIMLNSIELLNMVIKKVIIANILIMILQI